MVEKVAKVKKTTKTAGTKTPAKKAVEKVESTAKEEVGEKATLAKQNKKVSIDVYDVAGNVIGKVSLPGELFGEKMNETLLAQAVRVYLANKRQGTASTKTRGEVDGSTAKIYRQKGTGRARHGSKRAPIFVHGGVVFGPKPRDYSLALPQKMRRKALFCALSAKVQDNCLKVITGLEELAPKTKAFVSVLEKLHIANTTVLVVMSEEKDNLKRASRNLQGVMPVGATRLNAYDVLRAKHILVMKDAVSALEKHFITKQEKTASI